MLSKTRKKLEKQNHVVIRMAAMSFLPNYFQGMLLKLIFKLINAIEISNKPLKKCSVSKQ